MRAVVQRVTSCSVKVANELVGQIGPGLLVLLGVSVTDKAEDAGYLAEKIVHLRIFEDEQGRLNRSLLDVGGSMMIVSQFTLLGNCRKGRRPSFGDAAAPDKAEELYQRFVQEVKTRGVSVATGRFQAKMSVSLVNEGPVTLILESV
nr:D-tyrosyl-tRNA(Tyr) deacylase [Desulfobacterales bacterium]